MRVVVLGTGMIGTTIVSELAKFKEIKSVMAVDVRQESIDKCLEIADNPKVFGKTVTLSTEDDFIKVLEDADVAVGCLPHSLSLTAVKAAIVSQCHLVDLVGSMFKEKLELHTQAQEAGVTIIPGCGVAPGITNFLAAQGIEMLDEAEEAVLICGGIPRWPVPPLWYQVVFRLESVLGLYTKPAFAIKNGEIVELPALSELESMSFPYPVGDCEAVITDAHSTAFTFKGKVRNLTEKTVRYPGHWEKMKVLGELGFLDNKSIEIEGVITTPVKISEKILAPKMVGESVEDVTVVRVEVKGTKEGKSRNYTWEMVDVYDHERNISSMAKTTALPAAIAAKWIAEKKILETGVVPIESIIVNERFDPFVEELKELGIHIEFKE
ncbi:saccharopine dehydrogenase NADP-binding domain-containing protein [Sporosarcina aquimarina]|uniref:saccharopine dehydrogenase family protein n=1 Tax=Sporosarcina aquimarina TaxID=114975 RepID=UPI002041FE36|nr:saccharopine dehydrogenase C-terminal domain-containing protein [Sporosarcina aquimarina]MCM3757283.1 saccharopine dehydrogenase NADP-binding domain-containing protein [Sporosarcina aquimarina]